MAAGIILNIGAKNISHWCSDTAFLHW